MARVAREAVMYAGCYAHVISRSIRNYKIFHDRLDFKVFRELLIKEKKIFGFKVFHYCLMHTHFHLVVEMSDVKLFSKAIGKVKSYYSYKYHTKYRVSGPIWRERYKSLLIENEAYLYACGKYVENNPVRANMVVSADKWGFNSLRYYEGKEDELVDGYDDMSIVKLPENAEAMDKYDFETGRAIGSNFFKFQMREKLRDVPV